MHDEPPSLAELADLRQIANYQFGRGAGAALLPSEGAFAAIRTRTGRIEQCYALDGAGESTATAPETDDPTVPLDSGEPPGERLFTQATDGRFVLSVAGGRRLVDGLDHPASRVVVGEESATFVRDGRNAFAKFVREVDPDVRPGDDVVVLSDGEVLGVGRAELSAAAMADFDTGVAVFVRHGAGE